MRRNNCGCVQTLHFETNGLRLKKITERNLNLQISPLSHVMYFYV